MSIISKTFDRNIKTQKNNISYFIAGFKASMIKNGTSIEEIEELDYSTIEFGKLLSDLFNEYDKEEFNEDGLNNMYNFIIKNK